MLASDMKTVVTISITLSIALTALVGVQSLQMLRPRAVRAQAGCSASTLSVPYSYNLSGTFYNTLGDGFFYGDVGIMTPDGNGNLAGVDTVSNDGLIGRRTFTGTYTVNGNCTGSAKFQFSDGSTKSMDFTLGNGGKSINFIDSDNNVIVTGTATAQ